LFADRVGWLRPWGDAARQRVEGIGAGLGPGEPAPQVALRGDLAGRPAHGPEAFAELPRRRPRPGLGFEPLLLLSVGMGGQEERTMNATPASGEWKQARSQEEIAPLVELCQFLRRLEQRSRAAQ
jgi:hypothetical protein